MRYRIAIFWASLTMCGLVAVAGTAVALMVLFVEPVAGLARAATGVSTAILLLYILISCVLVIVTILFAQKGLEIVMTDLRDARAVVTCREIEDALGSEAAERWWSHKQALWDRELDHLPRFIRDLV